MIRTAQIQDIPTVVQLINASIRSCILDHQRRESDIQICLENITQTNILLWMHYNDSWVHVINNHILGFILVSDQGKILLHYVLPESQQQGIGKSLLFHIIAQAQQHKWSEITVDSTLTALPFYQKYAFEKQVFPADQSAPIVMIRSL